MTACDLNYCRCEAFDRTLKAVVRKEQSFVDNAP